MNKTRLLFNLVLKNGTKLHPSTNKIVVVWTWKPYHFDSSVSGNWNDKDQCVYIFVFVWQGPGHAMAIPSLPPLAEESVTVQNKDEHKSIADVFPSVQVENLNSFFLSS